MPLQPVFFVCFVPPKKCVGYEVMKFCLCL